MLEIGTAPINTARRIIPAFILEPFQEANCYTMFSIGQKRGLLCQTKMAPQTPKNG
jgi:hypothetical protein